jgi:hypothetical protein
MPDEEELLLPAAVAMAVALTAACVVLLAVGAVRVAGTTTYPHLRWVPVAAVLVLALVGIALLGAGTGRLVPSPVTPPVLAVAAFAVQVAALRSDGLLLTPVFRSVHISVFDTVHLPVTLARAVWFTGIGATGFCLFFATGVRARVPAVLPLVVAAAVAVPRLWRVGDVVVPDLGAPALVCDDDGPRVCVTRVHADYLPVLVGPAREALALMDELPSRRPRWWRCRRTAGDARGRTSSRCTSPRGGCPARRSCGGRCSPVPASRRASRTTRCPRGTRPSRGS